MHYTTISTRLLNTLIILPIVLFLIACLGGSYLYAKIVRHQTYLKDMQEFVEIHEVVKWEIKGKTFCYDPRDKQVVEATYRGNGVFRMRKQQLP